MKVLMWFIISHLPNVPPSTLNSSKWEGINYVKTLMIRWSFYWIFKCKVVVFDDSPPPTPPHLCVRAVALKKKQTLTVWVLRRKRLRTSSAIQKNHKWIIPLIIFQYKSLNWNKAQNFIHRRSARKAISFIWAKLTHHCIRHKFLR